MVNEFAPIAEKEEFTDRFNESIVVSIPTSAMIPNAMISTVRIVLNRFERMERKEILKFSRIRAILRKYWLFFFTFINFGTAKLQKANQNRNFLPIFNSSLVNMDLKTRISSFAELGSCLPALAESHLLQEVFQTNNWFTASETSRALLSWASLLTIENITRWTGRYQIPDKPGGRNILVITAGNIPLVGFHDFLSVLISGNRFIGKLSSRDNFLITKLIQELIRLEPRFADYIDLEGTGVLPDAVIATGSNNSARYFQTQYGHLPCIIRKNRSSVAILSGRETPEDLKNITTDVLEYYGLGCRSISHLYVPNDYQKDELIARISRFPGIDPCELYRDNLRYQRARLHMHEIRFEDAGNALLVESGLLHSPIGVVHYSFYDDPEQVIDQLKERESEIQCITGHYTMSSGLIPFGTAQQPALWDYADGIDTLAFLT
jgi:hypothetical protein